MKNISAMQSKFGSDSFKGWMIGAGCGLLLTVSLAVGSGQVDFNHSHSHRPIVAVQQPIAISGAGAVPPSIYEYRDFKLQQQALTNVAGLIPPPIDEIAQYRREEAAAKATTVKSSVSRITAPGEGLNQFVDQTAFSAATSRNLGPGEGLNQHSDTTTYDAGSGHLQPYGPGEGLNSYTLSSGSVATNNLTDSGQ